MSRWETVATTGVVDLAADPGNSRQVLATGPGGPLARYTVGKGRAHAGGRAAAGVPGLAGPRPAGRRRPGRRVYRSRDGGGTWDPAGAIPGPPGALDVAEGRWHAATEDAVYESADGGATWELVVRGS